MSKPIIAVEHRTPVFGGDHWKDYKSKKFHDIDDARGWIVKDKQDRAARIQTTGGRPMWDAAPRKYRIVQRITKILETVE